ncbi:hypothetical protein AB1Y20_004492 [Prymnesium parvum]|uniref:guanylate kinase n=1 Tax=Prymnesium parvum TaxID=97485 RepID=A0AB34IWV1_PRYPA
MVRFSTRVIGLSSGLVGAVGICRGAVLSDHSPSSLCEQRLAAGALAASARPFRSPIAFASSEPPPSHRPVVICGPSGVGKGTLLQKLLADFPDEFGFSVSHTTRGARPGEQDGVHYHFCEKAEMEAMIKRGEFIEYAHVHQNIYGTSIAAVETVRAAGKTCLLDIDVQGAQIVKQTDLDALFLFVAPPSFEELERRLRGRRTESEEKVQVRLETARKELAFLTDPANEGFFNVVIVNENLDEAYAQLKAFLRL